MTPSGKDQRNDSQFERRAQPGCNDRGNGPVLEDRGAHIALQQPGKIVPEPYVPGIVEPQRVAQILDGLGRRFLPEQHSGGIAGNEEQQPEGDDHHANRHGDHQKEAAGNIG